MMKRKQILQDLIAYRVPLQEVQNILGSLPWDSDEDLVQLSRQHVEAVLSRYLLGEISLKEIEDWANIIECREDIDYEEVADVLHVLANPAITTELTDSVVTQLTEELRNPNKRLKQAR